ncbi:MAG: UDP-N-acetylmuramoyl-tripeptide--D-alanyl-D-alanine ligase [Methylotetracoccus sp.]
MMRYSELAELVSGQHLGPDAVFTGVSIDTRTIKPGDLFVGIRGARFDGNEFGSDALAAGCSGLLVERGIDSAQPQVVVQDGRIALGRLAAGWRDRWSGRLVGVTGSNGKTTAKEMIAAILGVAGPTLATQGNLNNDIGVPLTLLRLRPEHRYAVIEMGANHPGEIAYVSGLARPDVAVITNAGAAHLEGFGSLDGVASAKGELVGSLRPPGTAVLNADDRYFGYWRELARDCRILSFGLGADADVRATAHSLTMRLDAEGFLSCFDLHFRDQRIAIETRFAGSHNMVNALAAAAAAFALGLDAETVQRGLLAATPVKGRLRPVRSAAGSLLIDDTYNANPSSFSAALDVLMALPGEHWVVLGAFGELGEDSADRHEALGIEARQRGVARLLATGPDAERAVAAFGSGAGFYAEQGDLIAALRRELSADSVVLVKGSRSQRMERVVEALVTAAESVPCC